MNARGRFKTTAGFLPAGKAFLLPTWCWESTVKRWEAEGLPADTDRTEHFGTDSMQSAPVAMQGPYGPHLVPPMERRVLSETAEHPAVRDEEGNTVRLFAADPLRGIPEWIEYPRRDRRDRKAAIRPRSLMGVERFSVKFYDDPGLVHEMCEHIVDLVIAVLTPFLERVQFDCAFYWEDMAGKAGPLCSPATFRQLMLPRLKRITGLLHSHGVHHIIVDSDGYNDVLIPLWLEAGIMGLRPSEVAAGCNPLDVRRRFGQSLIIQGGIDKRALAGGKADIDREVLSKVLQPTCRAGTSRR